MSSEKVGLGGQGSTIQIRDVLGPEEYPRLVEIWRSAVDATHHFLEDEHRDQIEVKLPANYLDSSGRCNSSVQEWLWWTSMAS